MSPKRGPDARDGAVPPETRFQVFMIGVGVCLLFFVGVLIFEWRNPKNLVYGETGHRAEMQFHLGTEAGEISSTQIATIEGTTNPKMLPRESA
jgi:hypothetical protein